MTELIPSPCEECGHVEYGLHYYVIDALVRKIARDSGDPLPKAGTGYYGDRADAIMFEALVEMIASGSGRGIHNCDHGASHLLFRSQWKSGTRRQPRAKRLVSHASEIQSEASRGDTRRINVEEVLRVGDRQ